MFKTLLIANRGEIAVRIIKGCKRLGMRTIAVYSQADRRAVHVTLADTACLIGPADATHSYLDVEAIIAAARRTGAEAIHPGYGFLSESLALITACEREGIVFVGPSREAIRLMGSKIESKRIAAAAGVPIVPGYGDDDQADATLTAAAEAIGYPILIKASAGGGGRGMRVVRETREFAANLDMVRREAGAAFGDGDVLLERYIREPRHLEVQVLGDRHGNLLHLFERECSIQRNNQKVIEEAPAPHLIETSRAALHAHALAIARAVAYDSVGTVEFIHDNDSGETFFLEMNTRLQVEHPVTEMITGIDLVEWQLRVAAGEALPFAQDDIACKGWAIEARVCAENPAKNFQPEIGQVLLYRDPLRDAEGQYARSGERIDLKQRAPSEVGNDVRIVHTNVRIDSGIATGSEVTPYYDSLLAKVIVHANDRATCARTLAIALDDFTVLGVGTNLAFLADIVRRPEFAEPLSTRFLERAFPGGWKMALDDHEIADENDVAVAAVACVLAIAAEAGAASSPWQSLGSWRVLHNAGHVGSTPVLLEDEKGHVHRLLVSHVTGAHDRFLVQGLGAEKTLDARMNEAGELIVENDAASGRDTRRYRIALEPDRILLAGNGRHRTWRRLSRWTDAFIDTMTGSIGSSHKGTGIVATMPGVVIAVNTTTGAQIAAGEVLVLLEAMKMIQSLSASVSGRVESVRCRVGDTVKGGDRLIEIETQEDAA